MSDTDLIAQFLAKGGAVKSVQPGLAYGVSPEADKAKRAEARAQRQYVETECDHDARMEQAHDAFFMGDKDEGYRLLGERRYTAQRPDGRSVRLNRF